jgi:hypothetical protein
MDPKQLDSNLTLIELQALRDQWNKEGSGMFNDLVMIGRSLGQVYSWPHRNHNQYRIFNTPWDPYTKAPGITLMWSLATRFYVPAAKAWENVEMIFITIGQGPKERSDGQAAQRLGLDPDAGAFVPKGESVMRETVVCRLWRIRTGDEIGPVVTQDPAAIFRPGKWTARLMESIHYAREIHNSTSDLKDERARQDLLKDLLIRPTDLGRII